MKWRRVSGVAGPTYFSEDGQWTILVVKSGEHRRPSPASTWRPTSAQAIDAVGRTTNEGHPVWAPLETACPIASALDVDVDRFACHRGDKVVAGSGYTGIGA